MTSNLDNTAPIRYSSTRQSDNLSDDEKRARRKRSERDFNRVLSKTDDEHHEPDNKVLANEEEADKTSQEDDPRKTKLTLFDLSSPKKVTKDASSAALAGQIAASHAPAAPIRKSVMEQAAAAQAPVKGSKETTDSPSVLYGKMRASKKEGSSSTSATDDALTVERELRSKAHHEDATADADAGGGFNSRFATEQSDLSYVNPLATGPAAIASAEAKSAEAKADVNMQQIIDQLVDKVYVMQSDGKTEMTIMLKHPPLFEGANLVVTSFDSAKGEFNISFQNLTQAAKRVLDMQVNQESLRHGLEVKGYMIHIVTTTTQIENRLPIDQPSTPDKQRGGDGRFAGGERGGGQGGGKRSA